MVFVFDLHLTTYQSNYWCPIKPPNNTRIPYTRDREGMSPFPRWLPDEWNRKWVSWSPGTSNVLSRVTQNRLILVGIWPSRQKNCQHAQTAAWIRLRHPWCPGSKSTTIATVTSGRNATYRNPLTQRKTERGHGPVFKVAKCVLRSPGTSLYYFFEKSLQCELQGHWGLPQPMLHPWSHCRFTSLGVNLPRRRRRGCHKQVGGMLP